MNALSEKSISSFGRLKQKQFLEYKYKHISLNKDKQTNAVRKCRFHFGREVWIFLQQKHVAMNKMYVTFRYLDIMQVF